VSNTLQEAIDYALRLQENVIIFEFDYKYHGRFHVIRPFAEEHYRNRGYIERARVKWKPEIIYSEQ